MIDVEEAARSSASPVVASAAGLAGLTGGALLVGLLPGLNWLIVTAAVSVPVGLAFRDALGPHLVGFAALSLGLVGVALHTSSGWLLGLNLLAAVGVASLAVARGTTWSEVALGLSAAVWRAPTAIGWLLRSRHRAGSSRRLHGALPLARGLILGGFLIMVFGALFAAADQAFAQLAERVLMVPSVELGLLPARIFVTGAVATFAGTLASFAPAARVGLGGPAQWVADLRGEPSESGRSSLGPMEWVTALAMLDALFAVFVAVQVTVLFGGRAHVLETSGLTFAQYARSGFFQLLVVAALTLMVLAVLARYARRTTTRHEVVLKVLGGILIALALVVLASALKRLSLYEEVYGFTRLRLVVHAALLWFAILFGLVALAGIAKIGRWVPRAVVALSVLFLLGLSLMRPDGFIAKQNVERFERTGKIDVSYLQDLSPDAVPALATLPEPQRSCALVALRAEFDQPDSLWSFNASRDTAREVLNNSPESASALETCY